MSRNPRKYVSLVDGLIKVAERLHQQADSMHASANLLEATARAAAEDEHPFDVSDVPDKGVG